jgi:hypothetical protein
MLLFLLTGMSAVTFNVQPAYPSSGVVSGVVTESDGLNPLVGASVEALQTGDTLVSSTVTSAGGIYSLSLASGSYKLRVSADNHMTEVEPVVNVTAGMTTTVNFKLSVGHMLVYDEFTGASLNDSLWDWVLGGWGSVSNVTSEPSQFSFVGLSTMNVDKAFVEGKVTAGLESNIIFEGRVTAYVEQNGPGVYGDGQPRGLRVGSDARLAAPRSQLRLAPWHLASQPRQTTWLARTSADGTGHTESKQIRLQQGSI